jgi:hypothetical protein
VKHKTAALEVGTVQIGPEEGELSRFQIFKCIEIHINLTLQSQTDVWAQPTSTGINRPVSSAYQTTVTFPTAIA